MALLTADNFLNQMIVQARLLDPSFSGLTGTPEYKIFSSVAQELAANQVDMTGLSNALNISSKVGSSLDQFISNFGMQRQNSVAGQGYVVFKRPTPAPANITVAQGTVIQANGVNANSPTTVQYTTSAAGTIAQGETASGPVAVQAITTGSATNIPAGALNQFVGTIPAGVSSVTNPVAINNGLDPEDDDIFKSRFQNTWARNLSGTTSSYLAVALAGAFSTKAVAIGQQSTFIEYIQIPDTDDAGYVNGSIPNGLAINPATTSVSNGTGLWTTALSDIPYAKNIFTNVPTFISDNGSGSYYYQQNIDYTFNVPPLLQGDALREIVTTAPEGEGVTLMTGTNIKVESIIGFAETGTLVILGVNISSGVSNNFITVTYTNYQIDTASGWPEFTGITVTGGVSGLYSTVSGNPIYQLPTNVSTRPNFTFPNVLSAIDTATGQYTTLFDATTGQYVTNSSTVNPDDTLVTVQALTPGQVIQSEFRYVSSASRNDINANIGNCIDVYVNNSNPQQTSCVFLPSSNILNAFSTQFNNVSSSPYYIENYRRDGEPERRPNIMNYWTPLFNPPITSIPSTITGPDGSTFFLGVHYWLVHEIGPLADSVRARDGIEWSYQYWGDNQTTPPSANAGYLPSLSTTSSTIMDYGTFRLPVEVDNYANDANIINMQATYDAQSPATTDVLAHGAKNRYFKFDVTLMYSSNASSVAIQSAIASTIQSYLNNQYFGTIIQLSSILEQISSVSGVQNVRWSNDLPTPPNQIRVIETDISGNPLAGASVDRYAPYTSTQYGSFTIEITGTNFGTTDTFLLSWNDTTINQIFTTAPIPYTDTASQIATAINTAFSIVVTNTTLSAPITSTSATTIQVANTADIVQGVTLEVNTETMLITGVSGSTLTVVRGWNSTTPAIASSGNAVQVNALPPYIPGVTVTTLYASNDPTNPYTQYLVTYAEPPALFTNQPVLPTVVNNLTQGSYLYNEDIFLLDDELPTLPTGQIYGDTLPGLIARTRAENTFYRPGIG